jgi:SAM-dependent methyltransferase
MNTRFYGRLKRLYLNAKADADVEYFGRHFAERNHARILEVGCNEEPVAEVLQWFGYEVTGVDARPYWLPTPHFKFIQADFNSLNFGLNFEDHFDAVVATSTIEHFGLGAYGESKDKDGDVLAMRKIREALRPGGRAYVTVPVGVWEVNWQGWRVYDEPRLKARIIQDFTVEKEVFFCSGPILMPALRSLMVGPSRMLRDGDPEFDGAVDALGKGGYFEVGSELDRETAFGHEGPEATALLILRRS